MASRALADDISLEAFFAAEEGVRAMGDLLLVEEVRLIGEPEFFRSRWCKDVRRVLGIWLWECSVLRTVSSSVFF